MIETSFETLTVDRRDNGVTVLILDRPRSANTISAQLSRELVACLEVLRLDPELRVLVLTGAGRHFCAGADLRDPEREMPGWLDLGRRAVDALAALDVPVIAAINGTAFGGGLEMALACDIRIAEPGARLGLPEIKFGALPGGGGLSRLQAVVGTSVAATLVMSGRSISADEGERYGLLTLASAGSSAVETALVLADELAERASYATRTAKLILRQSFGQAPDAIMAIEYRLVDRMATPEELHEEQRRAAQRDPVYARIFDESEVVGSRSLASAEDVATNREAGEAS